MDFKALGDWLSGEIGVVSHVSFWVAVGVGWLVIWKFVQREFAMRLANAQSTIDLLREKLSRTENEGALRIAAATQDAEEIIEQKEDEKKQVAPVRPKAAAPSPTAKKEFVADNVTTGSIREVFRGRTAVQAKDLLRDQIGKWMRVTGKVSTVSETAMGRLILMLSADDGGRAICVFPIGNDEARGLSLEQHVAIEGQISDVAPAGVTLKPAHLVAVA